MEHKLSVGKHFLLNIYGCSFESLNDATSIENILKDAAILGKTTIINYIAHQFTPQGVTGLVLLSESHISIHTWPERGYACIDFFSCNMNSPFTKVRDFILDKFNCTDYSYSETIR